MNVMKTRTIVILMPRVPIRMDRINVAATRNILEIVACVRVRVYLNLDLYRSCSHLFLPYNYCSLLQL